MSKHCLEIKIENAYWIHRIKIIKSTQYTLVSQLLSIRLEYCAAASTPTFVYKSLPLWLIEAKVEVWNAKPTKNHTDVKLIVLNLHGSFCDQTDNQFLPVLIAKEFIGGEGIWGNMSLHTFLKKLTTGLPPQINDLLSWAFSPPRAITCLEITYWFHNSECRSHKI